MDLDHGKHNWPKMKVKKFNVFEVPVMYIHFGGLEASPGAWESFTGTPGSVNKYCILLPLIKKIFNFFNC